jgi:hypothetical protein
MLASGKVARHAGGAVACMAQSMILPAMLGASTLIMAARIIE